MISIESLSKSYFGSQNVGSNLVFDRYCATFNEKRTCISAANGSGKSTLLLMIAGLLEPEAGSIYIDKGASTSLARKKCCALASDGIRIPDFLSARQVLHLTQSTWRCDWPEDLIERLYFDAHIDKTINALSAGNLKKLQLVNAFMRNAPVLLLDEPNLALDEPSLERFWQAVDEYSGQIVVASNEPVSFKEKGFTVLPLHHGSSFE